jgi:hypothetical protein
MDLDLIINKLDLKYYKSLQFFLNKNEIVMDWLEEYIDNLDEKIQYSKNIETLTENKKNQIFETCSSETENHKQIFSDKDLYKKPWVKINSIHKILKIKEFVNNLKIDSEQNRSILKDELLILVKNKILTKKEKVKYDEVNGKIISLTNLQYSNGKYYYNNE